MKPVEADPGRLQSHMKGTYLSLRVGIGLIGAALPLILWAGGRFMDNEPLRPSMSAYYYSGAMGDVFVGALVSIGVFLFLYRGFSRMENWALDLGGVLAIGVAWVPTADPATEGGGWFTWHGAFAVLFFVCIAYVCVFRASDTLSLVRHTGQARRLQRIYRGLGIGMVLSPLIALGLAVALQPASQLRSLIFFVEAVAVLTFAAYWLVKSREMKETDAQTLALAGKLQARSATWEGGVGGPGRLIQIEP